MEFPRTFVLLVVLLPLLLLSACEEAVAPDTPYVERLIVYGVLTAGRGIQVNISRSQPLDRPASQEEGWLSDAKASIVVVRNIGTSIRVPLSHNGEGMYMGFLGQEMLQAESGATYRLEAEWNGHHVTAQTTVPTPIVIEEARPMRVKDPIGNGSDYTTFTATYRPHGDQVYWLTYELNNPGGAESWLYPLGRPGIARRSDTLASGLIEQKLDALFDYSTRQILAVVHAFDAPYYDFYQTAYISDDINETLSGGNDLVRWNVQGDGIGLFIGRAISKRVVG